MKNYLSDKPENPSLFSFTSGKTGKAKRGKKTNRDKAPKKERKKVKRYTRPYPVAMDLYSYIYTTTTTACS